jgi:hypothetical protein
VAVELLLLPASIIVFSVIVVEYLLQANRY